MKYFLTFRLQTNKRHLTSKHHTLWAIQLTVYCDIWRKFKTQIYIYIYLDGLVQERHNSIAKALELRLSCTNPLICSPVKNDSAMTRLNPDIYHKSHISVVWYYELERTDRVPFVETKVFNVSVWKRSACLLQDLWQNYDCGSDVTVRLITIIFKCHEMTNI